MSSIGEIAKFRTSVQVNTINEFTSASGVTVDECLIKDGGVTLKTGSEIADAGGKYVKIKGGDGAEVVATGYVGEKVSFTARSVTLTNADTYYATAALATLGSGTWILVANTSTSAISGMNPVCRFLCLLSENNTANGTSINGDTAFVSIPIVAVATSISGGVRACLTTYLTTTGATLYGKGYCEDEAGQSLDFDGFAIRIA